MNKSILYHLLYLAFLITFTSCNDDLSQSLKQCRVEVRLRARDGKVIPPFDKATVTFLNLSSGRSSLFIYPMPEDASVIPGIYDVTFEASSAGSDYFAVSRSVEILSNASLVDLEVYANRNTDDLIISEIFFTGTLQTSGNQYYGDDYIKLYNNTDHVVYADGLTIFESKFLTTEKQIYTPDIMATDVTAHALYTIPGTGREHPVEPGSYLLIADTGIDHRVINPNSLDLSHADWEWYDVSGVPSNLDIDSPSVPNLDKWYCYTNSFFMLHNRGYRAVGIARLESGKETFLRDNWYSYDYEVVTAVGTFPMSGNAYRIPNRMVIDVVNCCASSEWEWNVTDPSLDRGWTWCAKSGDDKTRYGYAVRRKLLFMHPSGHPVFQDTDNSSEDFNPRVTPSEIERQNGLRITFDGITPVEE